MSNVVLSPATNHIFHNIVTLTDAMFGNVYFVGLSAVSHNRQGVAHVLTHPVPATENCALILFTP
jgi:hypothetical protein